MKCDSKSNQAKITPWLFNRLISSIRQPIESLFGWLIQRTDLQNASRVRSSDGLLVHCYGKFAVACLLLTSYSWFAYCINTLNFCSYRVVQHIMEQNLFQDDKLKMVGFCSRIGCVISVKLFFEKNSLIFQPNRLHKPIHRFPGYRMTLPLFLLSLQPTEWPWG